MLVSSDKHRRGLMFKRQPLFTSSAYSNASVQSHLVQCEVKMFTSHCTKWHQWTFIMEMGKVEARMTSTAERFCIDHNEHAATTCSCFK